MNYETIKQMAKEERRRITDYLALSRANDPFYVTPSRAELGAWFAGRLEEFGVDGEFHLRRIHYLLVTREAPIKWPDGSDYENTEKNWEGLNSASLAARYTQAISSASFVDRRNPDPEIFQFISDGAQPEAFIFDDATDWKPYGLPS